MQGPGGQQRQVQVPPGVQPGQAGPIRVLFKGSFLGFF